MLQAHRPQVLTIDTHTTQHTHTHNTHTHTHTIRTHNTIHTQHIQHTIHTAHSSTHTTHTHTRHTHTCTMMHHYASTRHHVMLRTMHIHVSLSLPFACSLSNSPALGAAVCNLLSLGAGVDVLKPSHMVRWWLL